MLNTLISPAPAAALLGLVLVALLIAYRAYRIERSRHMSLELLHAATRVLAAEPDPQLGLAGVLARSLDPFRAEAAEALLIGDDPARVVVTRAGHVQTSPLDLLELVAELRALEPHATVIRPGDDCALARHLRDQGYGRAMIAPMRGEEGRIGALLVAGRAVGRADTRLFETLAQQSGSLLGRDRLGRELRELQALRDELEHRAFHDPLTGLANRLLFTDRLRHALRRRQGSAAVVYIDLDDFKPINDTLGHEVGDAVLCAAAVRIGQALRREDTPARLGGDEFAVLLLDVREHEALIVAERLLERLRAPFVLDGTEVTLGASIGVAVAISGSVDGDELLRRADAAMYVTKHGGKRGVSVHANDQTFHPGAKAAT